MSKFYKKHVGIMAIAAATALCFLASNVWAAAPAAPTMSVAIRGLNVTVSWNSAAGATGYTLFYAPYPSATPIRSMDMGTRTSFSATLAQGAAFYVAVKARNASGSSSYSSIGNFTLTTSGAGTTVTDVDGNVYNTVPIGAQTWLKENIEVTKYRNGDAIPTTTSTVISNEISPKYQWPPGGNESNVAVYGRLYTWYAATDSRGVCPTGWHLPTDAEWATLTAYLGGDSVAGGNMKETGTSHWLAPNTSADNSSGFTALPGGYRGNLGTFGGIGSVGFWWSAMENDSTYAWSRYLVSSYGLAGRSLDDKSYGFSVRCVGD